MSTVDQEAVFSAGAFETWSVLGHTTTFDEVRRVVDQFAVERDWAKFHSARNVLFSLVGEVGEVADLFRFREDADCDGALQGFTLPQKLAVADELADVLTCLVRLATVCGVDLAAAWRRKMVANAIKYPVSRARGSAAKYTELAQATDGAEVQQGSAVALECNKEETAASRDSSSDAALQPFVGAFAPWAVCGSEVTLEQCRATMNAFHVERDWRQYHTPRNLALAMVGEVGEVVEHFQWRRDADCTNGLQGFTEAQRLGVADELADVTAYLIPLSAACGIDLAAAWMRKLQINGRKYPAALVRGIAIKHTDIDRTITAPVESKEERE